MEREILIANTKTQKRSKITTSATTLGELKTDLRAAGIDFSNMTFTEGISKTQLLSDDTQLPQNVMYKGQPTNNLVILLTNTKKNIASGVLSRKEAYASIKQHSLQDAVKAEFGRNFTQVPTSDLMEFIETNVKKSEAPKTDNTEQPKNEPKVSEQSEQLNQSKEFETSLTPESVIASVDSTLFMHISLLVNEGMLSVSDLQKLERNIHKLVITMSGESENTDKLIVQGQSTATSDNLIDDDDIDDIIDDLGL
nr:MAG TPA: hypothetical protein [Caudoviricetes sp.]